MPHELVRALLDAVPGGVVHVAMNGSIEAANAEALRILGYRFDELTKTFVVDFDTTTIGEDGLPFPAPEYPVSKVLVTGEPQPPVTIGVQRPDGQTCWAVFRAVPARGPDGALIGAVVTFIDITERKRAEEELRRRERRDDDAGLVGVDVSDSGCGIRPEHIARIYDPLFTTKPSGTGLGLSISKVSIESMGGRIDVVSELGAGTTFTVWLSTTRRAGTLHDVVEPR